ncbi:hypothetical protein [Streptomyces sp. I5]|uniref:hypothetical protein n=1 Tax=Streptomyces sp. I5 TaxID=2759947 RepID=UPI0018EEAC1F|nr:hypothetical protein [Streptomyces sp. I5]MBJ6633381.1 hypothetical protein [Streptomyces sp. I5]
MSERRVKTMEDAPVLGTPLPDPEPAPGCGECRRWAAERAAARQAGDGTRVSDCNVQMRRHLH